MTNNKVKDIHNLYPMGCAVREWGTMLHLLRTDVVAGVDAG